MTQPPVLLQRVGVMNDPTSVKEYRELGGFKALEKAVRMPKEGILHEIDEAFLRGRGGAAYPMGAKWKHLYENPRFPKYIVCNADEGEPGTFKDRVLLSDDPLAVIEGMTIAGYVFGAEAGFIYIRGEYRLIQKRFQDALDHAVEAGYLGQNICGIEGFDYSITIVSGAGAYVCGENSALLNSIEAKVGRPRVKPPHLADVGLWGQPTLVNNVESYANVPVIIDRGGKAFKALGSEGSGGTKLVCLSGHVKNRGVHEIRFGTPIQDILFSDEYGGGISTGRPLGFVHFGGQSGPIGFPEQLHDAEYSYEGLWDKGLAVGSGAIVVMDDSVSVVEYLENVLEFFIHESCGKCTPCRMGTTRLYELFRSFHSSGASEDDLVRVEDMLMHMTNLSACGLGQSVSVSIRSGLKHRRDEFRKAI